MSLITEEYRQMQSDLHLNPEYGISSTFFAPIVDMVIAEYQIKELLDYGAGKCRLRDSLTESVKYTPYEPSNPLWDEDPEPTELVACIDVLEHIEPECLDNVLDDLQRCVLSYGIFTIHTGAALKVLPDGRNAHLIQEPWSWWESKLSNRFGIIKHIAIDNGIVVLVKHKD
jgi:hypothetical protein